MAHCATSQSNVYQSMTLGSSSWTTGSCRSVFERRIRAKGVPRKVDGICAQHRSSIICVASDLVDLMTKAQETKPLLLPKN